VAGIQVRDFDSPDETRASEKRRVEVVQMGDITATRFTLERGWKWSEHVGQAGGSEYCELRHVGVVYSGRLRVAHRDGTEVELGTGDTYVIEPGHDAWVIGEEAFQCVEFASR
jgi:uncharacterized cupin superfamily protein